MKIEVGYGLIQNKLSPEEASLITNHPKPLLQTPVCIVISKKIDSKRAQRLIAAFNSGLKRLKESGRYEQFFINSRQGKYELRVEQLK